MQRLLASGCACFFLPSFHPFPSLVLAVTSTAAEQSLLQGTQGGSTQTWMLIRVLSAGLVVQLLVTVDSARAAVPVKRSEQALGACTLFLAQGVNPQTSIWLICLIIAFILGRSTASRASPSALRWRHLKLAGLMRMMRLGCRVFSRSSARPRPSR